MDSTFCTFENLLALERNGNLPFLSYVDKDIKRRTLICIDWLYCVFAMFKLKIETWFLCVSLINRLLETGKMKEDREQVYFVTCLCIAAKRQEIYAPNVSDYVYICGRDLSVEDIVATELEICKLVGFCLDIPNYLEYLRFMSSETGLSFKEHNIAKYLTTLYCNYEIENTVLPSVLATCTNYMARCIYCSSNANNRSMSAKKHNPFSVPFAVINEVNLRIATLHERVMKLKDNELIKCYKKNEMRNEFNLSEISFWIGLTKENPEQPRVVIYKEYTTGGYLRNRCPVKIFDIKNMKSPDNGSGKSLGEGAFGLVKKVSFTGGDNVVYARKKETNDWHSVSQEGIRQSYIREVSLLQVLKHKNIVKMHGITDDCQSIILELMDCDLKTYYSNNESIVTTKEFQDHCTRSLLQGLNYIHSMGAIHRDIKPQNILVRLGGSDENNRYLPEIKYCDFGTCRGSGIVIAGCYTHEIITLWYRPPEVLLGLTNYDHSVDVWSLMCTLYEVFHRRPLFNGDCETDQLYKIFQLLGTPPPNTDSELWGESHKLPDYKVTFPSWKQKPFDLSCIHDDKIKTIIERGLMPNHVKRPTISTLLNMMNEKEKEVKEEEEEIEKEDIGMDIITPHKNIEEKKDIEKYKKRFSSPGQKAKVVGSIKILLDAFSRNLTANDKKVLALEMFDYLATDGYPLINEWPSFKEVVIDKIKEFQKENVFEHANLQTREFIDAVLT